MGHKGNVYLSIAINLFIAPAFVAAQQHGGVAPMPAAAPARPIAIASAPAAIHGGVHAVAPVAPVHSGGHTFVPNAHPAAAPRIPGHPAAPKAPVRSHPAQWNSTRTHGPAVSPVAEDDNGVPGLGFDYPHYAATHPNARHHFHDGSIFPFVGGGIFIPTVGYVEGGVPTEPNAEEPPPEPQDSKAEVSEAAPVEQAPVAPTARTKSNVLLPPTPEYIFVRRDGTLFFAVAYSWVNGNLQYVTKDGLRKFALSATLDLDATTQFNEQRGVIFHSPA